MTFAPWWSNSFAVFFGELGTGLAPNIPSRQKNRPLAVENVFRKEPIHRRENLVSIDYLWE